MAGLSGWVQRRIGGNCGKPKSFENLPAFSERFNQADSMVLSWGKP
jgi:hypothetical protein